MEVSNIISILALVTVVMGGQFATWRWLVGKLREDRTSSEERDNGLHRRVDKVKDDYVRRDDLMNHIARIEASQLSISTQLQTGLERINGRIDTFMGVKPTDKAG